MSSQALRLPPFGRILDAYTREKVSIPSTIDIFIGNNAKNVVEAAYANKRWGFCTYLPVGHDFKQFEWPINNQHVIIIDLDHKTPEFAARFAVHLLKSNPTTVTTHSEKSYYPITTYRGTGDIHHGRYY